MDPIVQGCLLLSANLLGFYLAYLYGRKTKKFRWREYAALLALPVLTICFFAIIEGPQIAELFIVSSCVGFTLEYLLGLAYHKALNAKLWEYRRLSVGGYTSVLTLPFWGVAGVIFWYLSKFVGL